MTTKIYVRGRTKVGSGAKQPMFRVVAVTRAGDEAHLKIEGTHFRKTELEQIAKDVGAELVYLHAVPEEERGSMKEE
ncbi:MAG: hypothetical protein ACP5E9_09940 [Candidatus Methanospirareceae archaeon]